MPFCHQCGTEVQISDRFCSKCGTGQEEVPQENTPAAEVRFGAEGDTNRQSESPSFIYKGVGIRFVAQVIDCVVCIIFFQIIGYTIASQVGGLTQDGFALQGYPAIVVQGLTFFISILYFSVAEAYWHGQTLGKKMTRIQVVREDGSAIDLGTALIRNVLRIIDAFGFYLVGAILVWLSPRKQRLGDRIAHTLVVKKSSSPVKQAQKVKKPKLTSRDDVFISDFD